MYIQSFKWSCRMLSNSFLHIAQYIVCNLYWTYLGIVFVCLCLCSVDWLLFVLILLKRQNTSTIDGLSLHCNLIEMWIKFQYMWWSKGLTLLFGSVHGHLFHITRWCNVITSAVLLFWSSQPSCQRFSVLVSCLVYVYIVNTSSNFKVNAYFDLTRSIEKKKLFSHSFWVTLTLNDLGRTSAGYEPVQWS